MCKRRIQILSDIFGTPWNRPFRYGQDRSIMLSPFYELASGYEKRTVAYMRQKTLNRGRTKLIVVDWSEFGGRCWERVGCCIPAVHPLDYWGPISQALHGIYLLILVWRAVLAPSYLRKGRRAQDWLVILLGFGRREFCIGPTASNNITRKVHVQYMFSKTVLPFLSKSAAHKRNLNSKSSHYIKSYIARVVPPLSIKMPRYPRKNSV
jgi:hypothetical protein